MTARFSEGMQNVHRRGKARGHRPRPQQFRAVIAALTLACLTIALGILTTSSFAAQGRGPAREIIKITDDIYRTRNGQWYGLFLVTREGIVLVDPISPDFATWVKGQLNERFPGV